MCPSTTRRLLPPDTLTTASLTHTSLMPPLSMLPRDTIHSRATSLTDHHHRLRILASLTLLQDTLRCTPDIRRNTFSSLLLLIFKDRNWYNGIRSQPSQCRLRPLPSQFPSKGRNCLLSIAQLPQLLTSHLLHSPQSLNRKIHWHPRKQTAPRTSHRQHGRSPRLAQFLTTTSKAQRTRATAVPEAGAPADLNLRPGSCLRIGWRA